MDIPYYSKCLAVCDHVYNGLDDNNKILKATLMYQKPQTFYNMMRDGASLKRFYEFTTDKRVIHKERRWENFDNYYAWLFMFRYPEPLSLGKLWVNYQNFCLDREVAMMTITVFNSRIKKGGNFSTVLETPDSETKYVRRSVVTRLA